MALLPDTHHFHLWRGATFRAGLTLYTDEAGTNCRNLTGYTADLTIKDEPGGTPLLSLTSGNGGIVLGGTQGTIDLTLSAAATAALTWDEGFYDFIITAGSGGDTDALLTGKFIVHGV